MGSFSILTLQLGPLPASLCLSFGFLIIAPVPQFPCSPTSASKLVSLRAEERERDISSLGLTADSYVFPLS